MQGGNGNGNGRGGKLAHNFAVNSCYGDKCTLQVGHARQSVWRERVCCLCADVFAGGVATVKWANPGYSCVYKSSLCVYKNKLDT
eukprot:1157969-Pelagomonas_calceolata.AAC.20